MDGERPLRGGIVNVVEVQALCFFCGPGYLRCLLPLLPPFSFWRLERKSAILGLFSIVTTGVQPLAAMGWGAVVDSLGVQATIIMAGGLEALFSIWMLSVPFWRNFRFTPDDCPEGP